MLSDPLPPNTWGNSCSPNPDPNRKTSLPAIPSPSLDSAASAVGNPATATARSKTMHATSEGDMLTTATLCNITLLRINIQ
jgi:hypothetical protein